MLVTVSLPLPLLVLNYRNGGDSIQHLPPRIHGESLCLRNKCGILESFPSHESLPETTDQQHSADPNAVGWIVVASE